MGKPRRIDFTDAAYPRSGVTIEYVRERDEFVVSGWYDTYVGIEPHTMSRAEFERQLGIPAGVPKPA